MCPNSGGVLIERKGKYGNFKGCLNFPKCRYTA
ncbi:topoisomerase DNA-binding C4 zinc finger domain-containing protein [Metabacillus bambusae]|nr:topoisomerase DNA-binding C4 zinc finger domain-containing protein [Metabacillus bambusae]